MESTVQALCFSRMELESGTTVLGFTFEVISEVNDRLEEGGVHIKEGENRIFKLITKDENLEVLWSFEAKNKNGEFLEWNTLKLLRYNRNIHGNFLVQASGSYDLDFYEKKQGVSVFFDMFDTDSNATFEKNFKIQDTHSIKLTIFIIYCKNGIEFSFLAKDYEKFLNDQEFSDFTFVIGNEEIRAHSQIVSARNQVFGIMLNSEKAERVNRKIMIMEIKPYIFKLFLKFIYSGILDTEDVDHLLELVAVANKYSVGRLIEACERILVNKLSIYNVIYIFDTSDLMGMKILKIKCIGFIIRNRDEVMLTQGYKDLVQDSRPDFMSDIIRQLQCVKPDF